jgi:hypothetical protein
MGGEVRNSIGTSGGTVRYGLGRIQNRSSIASRDTAHKNNMAAYHFDGICVSRWVVESLVIARFKRRT